MIKAIETMYNGYRFRSRLEARWAVFFDALEIKYEYESQGFDLGELGQYLPDFWLPELNYCIEVKGKEPTQKEYDRLAAATAIMEAKIGVMLWGNIPAPEKMTCYGIDDYNSNHWQYTVYGTIIDDNGQCQVGWEDGPYIWCECPSCGRIEIQFEGRSDRMKCKECTDCLILRQDGFDIDNPPTNEFLERHFIGDYSNGCPIHGWNYKEGCKRLGRRNLGDRGHNANSDRLFMAYLAARQARFEHGQIGAPSDW